MGRAAVGENPFQPGAGARPPVLAGRDTELARADHMLDSLERGRRPSEGFLLFGPRGNGKTVLLSQIADKARSRGMRAEKLAASAFASKERLTRRLQEKAGALDGRITGAQAAGFGISGDPARPIEDIGELLLTWVRAEATPLVILLDEAHTIGLDAGRAFFNAVQEAIERELRLWLIAAGTPDAPRQIRQAGTFTERMFEQIPIGRLERGETVRALREPANDSGLPLGDDAAALLAAKSQDYPYFIQLLGSAAWTAADDVGAEHIDEQSVRRGIAALGPRIQRFYAQRFNEARGRKVADALVPLAAHLRDRGGRLGERELGPLLSRMVAQQSLSGDETWLLDTLSDLGVLWQNTGDGWTMGIPSFADYLLTLEASEMRNR